MFFRRVVVFLVVFGGYMRCKKCFVMIINVSVIILRAWSFIYRACRLRKGVAVGGHEQ